MKSATDPKSVVLLLLFQFHPFVADEQRALLGQIVVTPEYRGPDNWW
jgi:hypothetical protein